MFDKTKVVLIGCVACSGVFLDKFSAVWADPAPIQKTELMAPLPVRFRSQAPLDFVKPVPRDPRLPPREAAPRPMPAPSPLTLMMLELNERLKAKWKNHKGKNERVVVLFHLNKDGSVSKVKVEKASGSQITDDDAISAIRNVCPFLKLPSDLDQEGNDVQVTFSDSMFYSPPRASDPVGGYTYYRRRNQHIEY